MPSYKLTYFDDRGRAELIRWLFLVSETEFEDIRISRDDWPALKPNTPLGQLPVLEVDGWQLAQSNTIAFYLAKQFNLLGQDDKEAAFVHMILDLAEDARQAYYKTVFGSDEAKEAALKSWEEEGKAKFLALFVKFLRDDDGYIVGDNLTLADLAIHQILSEVKDLDLADHPRLLAHKLKVLGHPALARWIMNRPDTPF